MLVLELARWLAEQLGNPDAKSLKECLEDLCEMVHEKGLHYGDYRLKASLRTAGPAAAGSAAEGSSSGLA